eukprot:1484279-Pleurochrysis_carterae.AAC.1
MRVKGYHEGRDVLVQWKQRCLEHLLRSPPSRKRWRSARRARCAAAAERENRREKEVGQTSWLSSVFKLHSGRDRARACLAPTRARHVAGVSFQTPLRVYECTFLSIRHFVWPGSLRRFPSAAFLATIARCAAARNGGPGVVLAKKARRSWTARPRVARGVGAEEQRMGAHAHERESTKETVSVL